MAQNDGLMERINEGISLCHKGEREEARAHFEVLWDTIGAQGDPFHRCTLAHYMADVQDDPREELTWDLKALQAADSLTDDRVQLHHEKLELKAFYPSLHLNLAQDYRKLGDRPGALRHLRRARESMDTLPETGYGAMIRSGIARLTAELRAETTW